MVDTAKASKKANADKTTYKYKSHFGSHKDMIVENLGDGFVICKDEHGKYKTSLSLVDSGVADPNRFDLQTREVNLASLSREE